MFVLSLFLKKPLKCKNYFALFLHFFFFPSLLGFLSFFKNILSWVSNGVYSLAISQTLASTPQIFPDGGREGGRDRGEGVPSHPVLVHPASLVPGHQPQPPLHHHHRHTVAHTDSTVPDKIPSDSELPTGCFGFFRTAITTMHITVVLYSVTYSRHTIALFSPLRLFSTFLRKNK